MQRKSSLVLAKIAVITAAVPFLLYGYFYGPDPGFTGAPSDNGGATCATAGCHSGTANQFSTGSVKVNFPNGLTYTPGVAQQLSVTISDSATTQKSWGFQLTPRLASAAGTMAGTLTSASDGSTEIMYSEANLEIFCAPGSLNGQTPNCPGASNSTLYPLQFAEHSYSGYMASVGKTGSYTYNLTWTPPATNVGNIIIYVAGNAGTGTLVQATTPPAGDHIYSTSYTLTPASSGGSGPTIASAGVVNGASFQTGIVPNSWITIQGTNLYSGSADTWANAIVNGNLPTKLDGVSVSVGGQAAYIYYVSSTQINAIAPNIGTGSMPVTVTNSTGTSSAVTAVSQTVQPAFFLWPGSYAVATHTDFSLAVKNGAFSGTTTIPAKAGETIILWGTGFGATTPAFPVGIETPASTYLSNTVTVTIGGVPASVYQNAAALAPGFASLYQLAVTVPASLASGDYPVVASIGGAQSPSTTMITVQ
jgi:uncharacterized protein (TIGR03437 family)